MRKNNIYKFKFELYHINKLVDGTIEKKCFNRYDCEYNAYYDFKCGKWAVERGGMLACELYKDGVLVEREYNENAKPLKHIEW